MLLEQGITAWSSWRRADQEQERGSYNYNQIGWQIDACGRRMI
jgi:hypothetical protein